MTTELLDRQIFNNGDDIIMEGQEGLHLFIIEKGHVEVWKRVGGEKKVVTKLGPGRIFGEMALIDNSPRYATVTAIEQVVCLRVSQNKLSENIEACPPFIKALIKILVNNIRISQEGLYGKI
jgi:CRP/FNR family cyclic AMP-dependent transcriptional regulator